MKIVFETERLRVRHFTSADHDNYFALQGNSLVMQYIRPPRTRKESDLFLIEKILTHRDADYKGYWAVDEKQTGIFVGCFVIIPLPEEPDKTQMGYSFLPEYWGRGYATEVTMEGVQYFHDRTPLQEIYGVTETENIASQKVLLKAGFKLFTTRMEQEKELNVFILRKDKGN